MGKYLVSLADLITKITITLKLFLSLRNRIRDPTTAIRHVESFSLITHNFTSSSFYSQEAFTLESFALSGSTESPTMSRHGETISADLPCSPYVYLLL